MNILKFILLPCLLTTIHVSSTNGDEAYDAAIAVGKILKQALGFVPGVPQFISVADLFINIISTANAIGVKKGDLWTQIEDRVSVKIGQSLSGYHLSDVKSEFRLFTTMIEKKSTFDKDDLNYIMAKKLRMIPQNYQNLGFTTQLATLLPAWTGYMVTGHLELISRNKLSTCSLANELTSLRGVAINAAKSLFQKRYRDLKGSNFYTGSPNSGCAGRGIQCRFMARFVFTDSATNKEFDNVVRTVFYHASFAMETDTTDLVWKHLIQPINAYFKKEICRKGCLCPQEITRKEITFSYPYDCFGQAKNNKCSLPCQTYGNKYTWCPAYTSPSIPSNNLMNKGDWQYCTPADFMTCMPVSSIAL